MGLCVAVLLMLSLVTVDKCQCVDLRLGEDAFDRSEGASGQVTSDSAEVAGTLRTGANALEEPFALSAAASSTDKLTSFIGVGNVHNSLQGKGVANPEKSPTNGTDLKTKPGQNSDVFERTGNQNDSTLHEFEGHLYVSNNGSDSDNGRNAPDIGEGHVTPQLYRDDADSPGAATNGRNNDASVHTEGDSERDENNFDRFLHDVSKMYRTDTTAANNALLDDGRHERHSQTVDGSLRDEQQSHSSVDEYINNAFGTEEHFERVFNISEDDSLESEARHYSGYQADGGGPAEQTPQSRTEVPGSSTESTSAHEEDNIPALDSVFEVHHYARSFDPGDPHVARHNETLAERVEHLILNRLPPLSNDTGIDGVGSGHSEPDDVAFGVEISPDEIDENDEETHSGVSLAFVFDSTGSMWDDLVQVKIGAERIMATMLERPDKPIYNYVLVPFHDPSKSLECGIKRLKQLFKAQW
jgi:hypothetical protein